MVANCPCCKAFAEQPRASGRVTLFTADGVTHAVPEIWLAGRLLTIGTAIPQALADWAWHCAVELTRDAQV